MTWTMTVTIVSFYWALTMGWMRLCVFLMDAHLILTMPALQMNKLRQQGAQWRAQGPGHRARQSGLSVRPTCPTRAQALGL